mmetsp:Transcript_15184/g.32947  ORF Transcript_15184/g.32947 Transcript_15184/m.32947 type:complete len:749 (+) Transcript_15184:272-2518(+)|eukprot:CAMPEP_0172301830 /NCGR_PEP_ID=MMETSP1058-20130122/3651_1 /TAXON_ID=83371 /ORGANISM="Detonula confervacea, Strain CCMP 353" /LENGTH=748 /DNA_ID=CAMNT_0013012109 /DNA_START=208 /DNA_END=2454 /DNA_ORIENTATION=+
MSTYVVGKDIQALVADIGSFSTKIGYAGDDHPQAVYNSTTAVERSNNNGSSSNFSRGPKRDFVTRSVDGGGEGNYDLVNPVDPVTGWLFSPPTDKSCGSSLSSNDAAGDDKPGDAWESHELVSDYLQHAFRNALGLDTSVSLDRAHNHPLLLLDKPHAPPAIRQRLLEIMFETHNLPAVFFLRDAIASCYAVGRTTATVVDVGYSSTMVTPVYEGFVETRGVLRNNACSARATEEHVLDMMDGIVKKQGGRRRKDRMRRTNQRRMEKEGNSNNASSSNNANNAASLAGGESSQKDQQQQSKNTNNTPPKRMSTKRDASGHFIKESTSQSTAPIPDYLMPLYQVRRAPSYAARSTPFHDWSRLTLARQIKEMGLGVAVGPMGYVSSAAIAKAAGEGGAAGGAADNAEGETTTAGVNNSINPATANSVFLTSSKLPYTLPDGTPVEITTASRCDVVELFFGNDEINTNYREQVLDESMQRLEEYETEIEEYIAEKEGDDEESEENNPNRMMGITSSSAGEAGDPYSTTSYRSENKSNRHGRGRKKTYYSPNTISKKLYSACLPYVRTAPPNANNGELGLDGPGSAVTGGGTGTTGGASSSGGVNDNYFHYLTSAPPAQMVCDAAFRCDRDQQASLLGNVVVCGGGSCITGAASVGSGLGGAAAGANLGTASMLGDEHAFPDRLREEVEAIVHRHTPGWRVKVTSPNISERAICSWLGGSILGSLGTFQDMWISRKDYEEFGSAIVNRKCP